MTPWEQSELKSKELLRAIDKFFGKEDRKLRKRKAGLERLLAELQEKEERLSEKIGQEKDKDKIERLEQKLAIIQAQHGKGLKALEGIEASLVHADAQP